MKNDIIIPDFIKEICGVLQGNGFEAYVVGGAVRDLLMGRKCLDFDIATSALPRDIALMFPSVKTYGSFGTMLIMAKGTRVEITPFRDDAPGRKPRYNFGGTIYSDLSRRDFTINSIAFDPISGELLDPHRGIEDIKAKIIRCTGGTQRIWEDPLRAMRAARFEAQLGFDIEASTLYTLKAHASELESISRERIRDELLKLVVGDFCYDGLVTLIITDLMKYIIPELMEGLGVMHYNKPMDVLEHNLIACRSIKKAPVLRLAALLHDIAKPRVAVQGSKGLEFPKHHRESAILAEKILRNLRCNNTTLRTTVLLIRYHMFYYTQDSELSKARKLVSQVCWDNIYDLIELRIADRIASGFDQPLGAGLEKLLKDLDILKKEKSDYRIKDLAISGNDLVEHLHIPPGPEVGRILNMLLDRVLEDPALNRHDDLLALALKF